MKNEPLHKTYTQSSETRDPIIRLVLTENGKSLFAICMCRVPERMATYGFSYFFTYIVLLLFAANHKRKRFPTIAYQTLKCEYRAVEHVGCNSMGLVNDKLLIIVFFFFYILGNMYVYVKLWMLLTGNCYHKLLVERHAQCNT